MAALVVPVQDPNYQLYLQQTNLQTLISSNASPTQTLAYRQQLQQVQVQLVNALMASGRLPASAILSACIYGAVDTNAATS